jgi:hypothetical protein
MAALLIDEAIRRFRLLTRRSAVPLSVALRHARRSSIIVGSFFGTWLDKRSAAASSASRSSASADELPTTARAGRYSREELSGDIVALRLLDSEPATLDAWYEECTTLMSGWTPDRRLRYLHDVRSAEALKPHSIDRVTKVLKSVSRSDVQDGRGAILLNNKAVATTLNSVVRYYISNKWQIRCFSDEAEALRWLSE